MVAVTSNLHVLPSCAGSSHAAAPSLHDTKRSSPLIPRAGALFHSVWGA